MVEITTTGKTNGRVLVSYGRLNSIQVYGFDTYAQFLMRDFPALSKYHFGLYLTTPPKGGLKLRQPYKLVGSNRKA